jgi:GNAT superfamily N-acetyltransferase
VVGAEGYHQYLAALASQSWATDCRVFVATHEASLLGALELRRSGTALVVNNIVVDPIARGQGVGKQLMVFAAKHANAVGLDEIALNVFSENQQANDWYESLGFECKARVRWQHVPKPEACGPADDGLYVTDFPQASAVHERYGFAQLSICRAGEKLVVGMLGTDYFRLTDLGAAADIELAALLHSVAPSRKLLLVNSQTVETATTIAESFELKISIKRLLELDR